MARADAAERAAIDGRDRAQAARATAHAELTQLDSEAQALSKATRPSGKDRLLGETKDIPGGGRSGAKDTFSMERTGVASMALGIIEKCLELSVQYAKDRVQFGQPIGEFQLIQEKLARMEVARLNVQNLVFRTLEMGAAGKGLTLAEASAMKLYSARAATEVALEAVQIFGGNGYMSEFHVEQLARDAKVLQIYAGTDEIQITHIARSLLSSAS